MHWDRLFEDLEDQLASEWEAERAVLDAESERLRVAKLELRSRLRALCGASASVTLDLAGGSRQSVRLRTLGADWVAAEESNPSRQDPAGSTLLIPLTAVHGIRLDHGLLLGSLHASEHPPALQERMTFGFVLRDVARRRLPVHVRCADGEDLHGTIDRAGADHFDLAIHDPGVARRSVAVRGFRILPFASIAAVRAVGVQTP